MKIVLVSDNHGDLKPIEYIIRKEYNADYYLHCGDSCLDPSLIRPFAQVKGNNDFYDLPNQLVLKDVEGHNILIIHGHRQIYYRTIENLSDLAKTNNCDIVFFGHTHLFFDEEIKGIRFINPGSLQYNRDDFSKTYAVVDISKDKVVVTKKIIS